MAHWDQAEPVNSFSHSSPMPQNLSLLSQCGPTLIKTPTVPSAQSSPSHTVTDTNNMSGWPVALGNVSPNDFPVVFEKW